MSTVPLQASLLSSQHMCARWDWLDSKHLEISGSIPNYRLNQMCFTRIQIKKHFFPQWSPSISPFVLM